jgi:hypothetical protein
MEFDDRVRFDSDAEPLNRAAEYGNPDNTAFRPAGRSLGPDTPTATRLTTPDPPRS